MTKEHTALSQAPKTLREALTRALAFIEKGENQGACCYEAKNGDLCVIGDFLTPEQRQDLIQRGLNFTAIAAVIGEVGIENIHAMTRMSFRQAHALQIGFDRVDKRDTLISEIKSILKHGRGQIRDVKFYNLDKRS